MHPRGVTTPPFQKVGNGTQQEAAEGKYEQVLFKVAWGGGVVAQQQRKHPHFLFGKRKEGEEGGENWESAVCGEGRIEGE
jgi:hypothetical protein